VAIDWNAGQLAMRWHQSLLAPGGGPETIDQAARVPGVTPAALSALYVATMRQAAA